MLKNILLWRYGRSTWQYDVLCVLILIFVFLTPVRWFERGEPRSTAMHRSPVTSVIVAASAVGGGDLKSSLEKQVQSLTGRADVRVTDVRTVRDAQGRTVSYQVDIE